MARLGAANGIMVIAEYQSAGRGRSDNNWLSPANSGLYLSFIIRPNIELAELPVITLITGVAVARAIQSSLDIKVGLKWVNDLIVEGKKVGGILAEYVSHGPPQKRAKDKQIHLGSGVKFEPALVIGIGLNLFKPANELPSAVKDKIGFLDSSLSDNANSQPINPNQIAAFIANELETALEQMPLALESLLDQWRNYSVTLGEEVVARVGNNKLFGEALDITDGGALILKTNSGNVILPAGEISIRKPDNSYV